MAARELPTIVNLARRRAERQSDHDQEHDRLRQLARQLGETVANAADADQWTTYIEGVDFGGYTFPLPPRPLLRSIHGGRRAAHEKSIPLSSGGREIGSVRLLTIRPKGFQAAEMEQARGAADCAARLLALALDRPTERTRGAAFHEPPLPLGFSPHGRWGPGFHRPRAS